VEATKIDASTIYRELLKRIVAMFQSSQAPLSATELFEPVAFQEAANASAERGGRGAASVRSGDRSRERMLTAARRGVAAEIDD